MLLWTVKSALRVKLFVLLTVKFLASQEVKFAPARKDCKSFTLLRLRELL